MNLPTWISWIFMVVGAYTVRPMDAIGSWHDYNASTTRSLRQRVVQRITPCQEGARMKCWAGEKRLKTQKTTWKRHFVQNCLKSHCNLSFSSSAVSVDLYVCRLESFPKWINMGGRQKFHFSGGILEAEYTQHSPMVWKLTPKWVPVPNKKKNSELVSLEFSYTIHAWRTNLLS